MTSFEFPPWSWWALLIAQVRGDASPRAHRRLAAHSSHAAARVAAIARIQRVAIERAEVALGAPRDARSATPEAYVLIPVQKFAAWAEMSIASLAQVATAANSARGRSIAAAEALVAVYVVYGEFAYDRERWRSMEHCSAVSFVRWVPLADALRDSARVLRGETAHLVADVLDGDAGLGARSLLRRLSKSGVRGDKTRRRGSMASNPSSGQESHGLMLGEQQLKVWMHLRELQTDDMPRPTYDQMAMDLSMGKRTVMDAYKVLVQRGIVVENDDGTILVAHRS